MSVTPKVLVPTQLLPLASTMQFESETGTQTILDKIVAFNQSDTKRCVVTVSICYDNETPSASNLLVQRTLQPLEAYLFPEITGTVLGPRDQIWTGTTPLPDGESTDPLLVFRMSGREVT